jgi:hypothetical protein
MSSTNNITASYTQRGSPKTATIWDGNSVTDAADVGSTVTYGAASSSSGASERWQANAAGTQPSFSVASNSSTFAQTYYDQLKLTVNGNPAAHDTPNSSGTAFGGASSTSDGIGAAFYDRASTATASLGSRSVTESGTAYKFLN